MKGLLSHLYETIAREAIFGIVVFDKEGSCLFINPAGVQMLGAENPKLADLHCAQEMPPFKNFGPELLKHEGFYQDILIANANGGSWIASIGVKKLAFANSDAHLLMLQDVTLQKKLQREITAKQMEIKAAFEELLKQNQQLKELDVAKNRFTALTTHELRTPLSAIIASAEILKLKLYDSPEQLDEFVGMIYEQGLHLQELVNDILDFAKIQAGKMDFYVEQADLVPVAQKVAKGFENMAVGNNVKIVFEKPERPLTCYFDELRLREVVSNIVNNAIKYNRPGGTVRVHFEDHEDFVMLSISDTGQGISADQFEKVFNEFETIGQVVEHHKGTGLGMPISRKLMESMGGKLLLESELGKGSTFWIEIPKQKVLADHMYQSRPDRGGDFAA